MEVFEAVLSSIANGKMIVTFPASELIDENIDNLEKELTTLGAKITSFFCYQGKGLYSFNPNVSRMVNNPRGKTAIIRFEKNNMEISVVNRDLSLKDQKETTIIIPGVDGNPLYVILSQVSCLFLVDSPNCGSKVTCIVWRGGGSAIIDQKYFMPLKKYWIKKRSLLSIIEILIEKDNELKKLLSEGENATLYNKYMEAHNLKEKSVEEQKYEVASGARDEEKKLIKEIEAKEPKFLEELRIYLVNFLDSIKKSF